MREVGDMLRIGKSSVLRILLDRVCARWVPLLLHEDQMQSRAFASKEFLKNPTKTCTSFENILI